MSTDSGSVFLLLIEVLWENIKLFSENVTVDLVRSRWLEYVTYFIPSLLYMLAKGAPKNSL